MKSLRKKFIALSGLTAVLLLFGFVVNSRPTSAVTAADWQAGRITDDSVFFNGSAMNLGDVQYFLAIKVPTCDTNGTQNSSHWNSSAGRYYTRAEWGTLNGVPPPYTCLKDYWQDAPFRAPESGLCNGFAAGNYSAAEIIFHLGQSCGVSQKALLVLLQKEQSLIDDDWPWPVQYRSATGYGCPDTAPCDAEYYGFFNQVYMAARQFKKYARDSHLYNHRANTTSFIAYNPQGSCGGSNVFIQNQATAGLYNYTPYQPNQAALNAMYGSAPPCGAYGNRNYWRLYNDWFGTTLGDAIGPYAYRLYNSGRRDHYFTARENERLGIKGLGFKDDGVAFKVGQTQEAGMVPIYKLYNGKLTDYWMVPDGMARYWGIVHGGYRDEGPAFFAYPANSGTSGPICAQGQAVFQMWHAGAGNHFYSTNEMDRYWALIHGGFIDDKSGNYNNTNQGSSAFCIPY